MGVILKGSEVTAAMSAHLAPRVEALTQKGVVPCLAIVRVGEREDDLAYENSAVKRCEKSGVCARIFALPESASQDELIKLIGEINTDGEIHGCLLLRPLPARFDDEKIRNALSPEKDVDGITDASLAGVFTGTEKGFPPCTAEACMEILEHFGVDPAGKNAVVIGRSLVVGKPLAMMLIKKNATVTVCHTKTRDLPGVCRGAEILIAAAGRAGMVGADFIGSGQTIVDVGINVDENGKLRGDVNFDEACGRAAAITPVPGGVGTVTSSVLVKHVVQAAERSLFG